MPKDAPTRKTNRREITQQDVYRYGVELSVHARPNDPYTRPADPGHVIDQLGRASWSTRSFMDMQAGKRARLSGQQLQGDESDAFKVGYDLIAGAAAAAQLREELIANFEQNRDLPPDKFMESHAQLMQRFTAGKSQAFLDGLLQKGLELEQLVLDQYNRYQRDKFETDALTKITEGFDIEVDSIYNTPLTADPKEGQPSRAAEVRRALDGAQFVGKELGLHRNKVTSASLDRLAARAIAEGRPELLDFAAERDQAGNLRLLDHPQFGPKIMEVRRQAEAIRERQQREAIIQTKEYETNLIDSLAIDLQTAISKGVDGRDQLDEIGLALSKLADPTNPLAIKYQKTRLKALMAAHARAIGLGNAESDQLASDPEEYRALMTQAVNGTLDLNDQATMDRVERLSPKDARAVLAKGIANSTSNPAKREYIRLGKELLRRLTRSDGLVFDTEEQAELYYNTFMQLEEAYEAFINGGVVNGHRFEAAKRPPGLHEIRFIHELIIKGNPELESAQEEVTKNSPANRRAANEERARKIQQKNAEARR